MMFCAGPSGWFQYFLKKQRYEQAGGKSKFYLHFAEAEYLR